MLKRLHLKNYRCFKDVSITFEPLTVLVGANGTGKTSLLNALSANQFLVSDRWQKDKRNVLSMQAEFTDLHTSGYVSGQAGSLPLLGSESAAQLLHFDLAKVRTHNQAAEARRLERDGSNLTNVFATIPRRTKEQLAAQFSKLVPHFNDVDVRPFANGEQRLVFQDRWKPDVWYEPAEVSDGTILVLAFLTLQFQDPPVDLVGIEEPERGLHPYLVRHLVQLLRKLSKGELGGKPVQVVLATHSAELLDCVEPNEVRFLRRSSEDGSVFVEQAPVDSASWSKVFSEYDDSLGNLWLTGTLGGVPGA